MARQLGISYKRLQGWEPAEETTFEYDDAGRVARTVTIREVEWDDTERGWMVGLDLMERQVEARKAEGRCAVCGGPAELCQNPEYQFSWVPELPVVCYRSEARLRAMLPYKKDERAPAMAFSAKLDPGRRKTTRRRPGRT